MKRPFQPVDLSRITPGTLVHVEGWNPDCQFQWLSTYNGVHRIVTPQSGRVYTTSNQLLLARRHESPHTSFPRTAGQAS
jgi:hypothetical protein